MPDLELMLTNLIASDPDEPFSLGDLVAHLRRQYPTAREAEIRWMTLELIRHLLGTGSGAAGSPMPGGQRFRPWALTPEQALTRIITAWDELGRAPRGGEIVWFTRVERPEVTDEWGEDGAGPGDA